MNAKIVKLLVEAADANGIEASHYEGYSGRGMFGEKTDGVVIRNQRDFTMLAIYASRAVTVEEANVLHRACRNARQDSLGLSTIIY